MSDAHRPRIFRRKRVRRYSRRGEIYAWLRTYHDQVLALLTRGEGSWPELVAEMVLDGISGRRGAELTPNAALKVWQRVRRDIEGADHAPRPRRKPPSKVSRDWRPQLALSVPQVGSDLADAEKPYDPLERIAEIRREMKARSGRKE